MGSSLHSLQLTYFLQKMCDLFILFSLHFQPIDCLINSFISHSSHEVIDLFQAHIVDNPEDTDWFVHDLYDFAPDLNMPLINAEFSRYVVDLNRDFKGESLYQDGRFITGVVPTQSFSKKNLYLNELPSPGEIQRRLKIYYWPYYYKIQEILL